MPNRSREWGPLTGCGLTLVALTAHPQGFNFGVDAGIGESDNVTLVQSNKISQTLGVVEGDFRLKENSGYLDEDVAGNFSYLDFLQHQYGSEFLGRFSGIGHYALIPGSLTWTAQDNWGQSVLDPFSPLVPTNQENINYFSTGPDFTARLSGTTFLQLDARYAWAKYSVSPFDNSRLLGTLQLGRDLSARSNVSVNGTVEHVMFQNTAVNVNYNLSSGYGRYELHGARTDFSLDVGATRINSGGMNSAGSLIEVELQRKLTTAASVAITAGRQLTDSSSQFNSLQIGTSISAANLNSTVSNVLGNVSSGVYASDYVSARWIYVRNRTTLAINARAEQDSYVTEAQYDNSRVNADFSIERKMTHALSLLIHSYLYKTRYDHDLFQDTSGQFTDQTGLYGAALTYREGRGLEIRLRFDHLGRDITAGAGNGYAENRIFLTVGYRPAPPEGLNSAPPTRN